MAKDIPIEQLRGRTFGRILVKMGILTREKVHECLSVQKKQGGGKSLGQVILELGLIDDKQLRRVLAAQRGMEYVDLAGVELAHEIIAQIPAQMANAYRVVPLQYDKSNNSMVVAIDSPDNFKATDDLSTLMGFKVQAKVASPADLDEVLKKYYSKEEESINDLIDQLEQDDFLAEFQGRDQSIDLDELKELAESNPVKKLLNLVLLQAIKDKASDIHFEPFESEFKMRYRIDGVLYEMIPPPKRIAVALSSRIKVMANLDIAERRLPQDGRIPLTVQGHPVDLRVSVLPTMFGESVVLRVLDRTQLDLKLDNLGLDSNDVNIIRQLIKKPNGILIVTGPTGSGKTTTLYAALERLRRPQLSIMTVEDPVERSIPGVAQISVDEDCGRTFGAVLRAILRQDPDVIMVGEMRDAESARIACRAALTGHRVLTTLHTADTREAVLRLSDLEVPDYLVRATLSLVIAQRLVRRLCTSCRSVGVPSPSETALFRALGLDAPASIGRSGGCYECSAEGYRGRRAVFELLAVGEREHGSLPRPRRTLLDEGLRLAVLGETTFEEVVAVCPEPTR